MNPPPLASPGVGSVAAAPTALPGQGALPAGGEASGGFAALLGLASPDVVAPVPATTAGAGTTASPLSLALNPAPQVPLAIAPIAGDTGSAPAVQPKQPPTKTASPDMAPPAPVPQAATATPPAALVEQSVVLQPDTATTMTDGEDDTAAPPSESAPEDAAQGPVPPLALSPPPSSAQNGALVPATPAPSAALTATARPDNAAAGPAIEADGAPRPAGKAKDMAVASPIDAPALPSTDAPDAAAFGDMLSARVASAAAPDKIAAATPPPPATPVISAQAGRIGHELGIEVARRVHEGGDELTVRLDPAQYGQIEVKMHFDDGGQLRATVTAHQGATLDLLRRDSSDLARAMNDAGIGTDAQSFRFEGRQDQSGHPAQDQGRRAQSETPFGNRTAMTDDDAIPAPPVRLSLGGGRIDMVA